MPRSVSSTDAGGWSILRAATAHGWTVGWSSVRRARRPARYSSTIQRLRSAWSSADRRRPPLRSGRLLGHDTRNRICAGVEPPLPHQAVFGVIELRVQAEAAFLEDVGRRVAL